MFLRSKIFRTGKKRAFSASVAKLKKKQVLDTVKLLGFLEGKIKRVKEALAKYKPEKGKGTCAQVTL